MDQFKLNRSKNQTFNGIFSDKMDVFAIFCYIVYIIGLVGNVINILLLHNNRFPSLITTKLFRSQCIFDISTIMLSFWKELPPEKMSALEPVLLHLACHIWYSQLLKWLTIMASILNLVCISLDRMIAVTFPIRYRRQQIRSCYLIYLFIVIYSIVITCPRCLTTGVVGKQCSENWVMDYPVWNTIYRIYLYAWLIGSYALPFAVIVTSHLVIIIFVKRAAKRGTTSRCSSGSFFQAGHYNQDRKWNERRSTKQKVNSLFKTTGLMSALFLVTRTFTMIRYFLNMLNYSDWRYGSYTHLIGLRIVVFSSCLNPIVWFVTVPLIREAISRLIQRSYSKVKRYVKAVVE